MKTYIKPNITEVLLHSTNALLGNSNFDPSSGTGGGNKGNYDSGSMQQLSNDHEMTSGSIWDEEE